MNGAPGYPMDGRGSLPRFWHQFADDPPYVHPADREVIEGSSHGEWLRAASTETFRSVVTSPDLGMGEDRFFFSLLPVPYAGDLGRADIFIVLLNPGFGGAFDFYVEYERVEWRSRLLANLRQDLAAFEFPNLNFDPRLCWTGAYRWWEDKLGNVARARAPEVGGYRNALRELSRRIACIEVIPYHSRTSVWKAPLADLPSAWAAMSYVSEVLLPKALDDRISLIVTRQVRTLGFVPGEMRGGLVAYGIGHSRGAGLGPDTPGGREILRRLRSVDWSASTG